VLRNLWSAAAYWPAWLGVMTGLFLLREVWALQTGHPQDTLSDWVWRILKVGVNKPVGSWTPAHFLVFGCWLVLMIWLTWHFFFRRIV
jgi:hypothetical protein